MRKNVVKSGVVHGCKQHGLQVLDVCKECGLVVTCDVPCRMKPLVYGVENDTLDVLQRVHDTPVSNFIHRPYQLTMGCGNWIWAAAIVTEPRSRYRLPVIRSYIFNANATADTSSHVGQTETICGTVAATHYAPRSHGQSTFLNLGHAYPNEDFTAVIWGGNRAKFGTPEDLQEHRICVTGPIKLYRGKPEVILESPLQLKE